MNLLIAESGATKTEWRLLNDEGQVKLAFRSSGLNPNNLRAGIIENRLQEEVVPQIKDHLPDRVIFYGSGCGSDNNRFMMTGLLVQTLYGAPVMVEHDLLAAARACADDQEGIICILGTGSNSCFYDGKKIVQQVGGLGYLLGDEGSGTDLGRRLLKALAESTVSEELKSRWEHMHGKSLEFVTRELYSAESPASILSAQATFIKKQIDHPQVAHLVKEAFTDFLERTVCRYVDFQNYDVHFTGSIAIHFEDLLKPLCLERCIRLGQFVEQPINRLVAFHRKYKLLNAIA